MSIAALPTLYDLDEPTTNLAGTPYTAWDGTPIGEGSSCARLPIFPDLHGFDSLEGIEDYRVTFGQDFALPLMVGVFRHMVSGKSLSQALIWGAAAYVAPLPVTLAVLLLGSGSGGSRETFGVPDHPRLNRRSYTPPPARRNWER